MNLSGILLLSCLRYASTAPASTPVWSQPYHYPLLEGPDVNRELLGQLFSAPSGQGNQEDSMNRNNVQIPSKMKSVEWPMNEERAYLQQEGASTARQDGCPLDKVINPESFGLKDAVQLVGDAIKGFLKSSTNPSPGGVFRTVAKLLELCSNEGDRKAKERRELFLFWADLLDGAVKLRQIFMPTDEPMRAASRLKVFAENLDHGDVANMLEEVINLFQLRMGQGDLSDRIAMVN